MTHAVVAHRLQRKDAAAHSLAFEQAFHTACRYALEIHRKKSHPLEFCIVIGLPPGQAVTAIMQEEHTNDTGKASAFYICIDTPFEGSVPLVKDDLGYVAFGSEMEAQREIADCMMTRLQEFLNGDREFDDAVTCQEFVLQVELRRDGSVAGNDENHLFKRY